jgi:glycosyltransferase involved in cell wall biosynthesis
MRLKRDIICIGTPAWEGNYAKSTVQLLSELAHEYRILYVDYQFTVKDIAATYFGKQQAPVKRMLGISDRLRSLPAGNGSSVYVLTPPPIVPVNWIKNHSVFRAAQSLNARIVLSSIRSAMKTLNITDPVVINAFNPSFGVPLHGKLNESLLLYYCYDNISAAGWLGKHGENSEKRFAELADVIVTSSDQLAERFAPYRIKTSVVKNGVDFALMQHGFSAVEEKKERVVGYIGSIDERLDYDLLDHVIGRLKDHQFRFIGRSTNERFAKRLSSHANVELLGAHPLTALPEFLRQMDVCIIPFAKNEFNRSIYPLKVNEYFAAGKPVVMTTFADLPEFDGVAEVADDKEAFLNAIVRAHTLDSDDQRVLRQDFAQYQSWTYRAKELARVIEAALSERKGLQS